MAQPLPSNRILTAAPGPQVLRAPAYPQMEPMGPPASAMPLSPRTGQSPQFYGQPVYRGSGVPQAPPGMAPGTYGSMRPDLIDYRKPALVATRGGIVFAGLLVLTLVSVLPCWDAIMMLNNINYSYWAGRSVPVCVLTFAALILIFFICSAELSFGGRGRGPTSQTLVMLTSLMLTLCGLVLIVGSLPISSNSMETYGNIVYRCHSSMQTRNTWVKYQQLLALRKEDACAKMYSIEECDGFKASREGLYLKQMETGFRCSGFCVQTDLTGAQTKALAAGGAANVTALVEDTLLEGDRIHNGDVNLVLTSTMSNATRAAAGVSLPPPTLFTTANFVTSCDGAAARDMVSFAKDIAWQCWYSGIVLISLSIVVGMLEWGMSMKS